VIGDWKEEKDQPPGRQDAKKSKININRKDAKTQRRARERLTAKTQRRKEEQNKY